MKKNTIELTLKHDDTVIIKEETGQIDYNSRMPIYNYFDVSCDFSRKNFKVTEFHYRLMRFENDSLANWQSRDNAIGYHYVSEKAIKAAEKMLKDHIKGLKSTLETGKVNPCYSAMIEIAKNKIVHYQDDFYYHDTLTIANNKPEKFLWFVRSTGTRLIDSKSNW
jgi:hypothetical protein